MSGALFPWDVPFDVLFNHNNGQEGLNAAGRRAYDKWQRSLKKPLLPSQVTAKPSATR